MKRIIDFFEIEETELIKINDQLVASGYHVENDEAAALYITELIGRLAETSGKDFNCVEFL